MRPTSLYFFSSRLNLEEESEKKDSFHEYLKILEGVDEQRLEQEKLERVIEFKKLG